MNMATDFRRRRRAHRTISLDSGGHDIDSPAVAVASQAPGPQSRAAGNELSRQILDVLDVLSPKLRQVIVLRYMQHLSYEEIGDIIEKPTGTVKSRLNRAHEKLKPLLEEITGGQS